MDDHGAPLPLPPGTKVREFQIEKKLGEGSFGIVYTATHEILGETVAIKEFLPRDLARRTDGNRVQALPSKSDAYEWAREKFLHEARTLKDIAEPRPHPNLVQVIHAFAENDTVYMCMRYEVGTLLDRFSSRGDPLPEHRLRKILVPLLDGLEHAHAHGVWHRDIKPSNILIREDGSPVLIDFGAARQDIGNQDRSVMAQCTPGYAAPEQLWSGEAQGPWTDIYALGATLYRLITGEPPQGFSRTTLVEDYRGKYSQGLLAAIDAALEPKSADRPQTVREWRKWFESSVPQPRGVDGPTVLQSAVGPMDATQVVAPDPVTTPEPVPPRPPPVERVETLSKPRNWVWTSLGMVIIAIVAGALWRWFPFPPDHESREDQPFPSGRDSEEVVMPSAPDPAAAPVVASTLRSGDAPRDASPLDAAGGIESRLATTASAVPDEMASMPAALTSSAASPQESGKATRRTMPDNAEATGAPDAVESEPTPPPEAERASELTPAARAATLALIEGLTADFRCARIETALSPDRIVRLSGHLGNAEDSATLRTRLLALDHVDSVQDDAVQIFGWPFCQVIAALRDALEGADAGTREASILFNKHQPLYREGEYLVVTALNNNPRNGYIYLDYVDAAGDVVHMLPTPTDPDNAVEGWGQVVVGSEDEAACLARQCYEISAPHGRSLLVAVWSSAPLFPGPRHQPLEPATEYFSTLTRNIRNARKGGSNEMALSYRFMETRQ